MDQNNKDNIKATVRRYYGNLAAQSSASCGCQPSSCCGGESQSVDLSEEAERLGYTQDDILSVPKEANLGLGCGNPTAIASLRPGERVLDLGSGAGFDCFLAAKQVGEVGLVIGVDMTPRMIEKARANASQGGCKNVEFRLGEIERLPVADSSVDAILSNCVINLSPEKPLVFREAFRVLKPGGRLAISDIVATRQLPEDLKSSEASYCGCISGAATVEALRRMIADAGFHNISISVIEQSKEFIREWVSGTHIDDYVASAYIEAFKPHRKEGG